MQRGFTLIEVLVVIAIVAILSTVAYPSYSAFVQRGKIAEGTSTLADARVRLEQYFQDNERRYTTISGGNVCGVVPAATTYFTYSCTATDTTYTVTAAGVAAQGMSGFTFTINQANAQQTTAFPGASGLPKNCWIQNKGDGC